MKSVRTIIMSASYLAVVLGLLGALGACEEKPASKPSTTTPPKDEKAMFDPNLGKALAASSASAASARPPSDPTDSDGLPPTGIFSKAEADAKHGVGKPSLVQPGTPGNEPRLLLTPTDATPPKTLKMTVVTMMGPRRSLPSVDLTLGFKVEKPKKAEEGATTLLPIPASMKIAKADLSAQQPGEVPPQVAEAIAQMKGGTLNWSFGPAGGVSALTLKRSEGTRPELEHNLVAIAEAVAAAAVAPPPNPVGVGAAWIVESRDGYGGLDLLSYRMYRVLSIEGDKVTVSVEVKQYAVDGTMDKAGLPEGAELLQFESGGTGKFVITRGQRFAEQGELTHTMKLGLRTPETPPDQIMPLGLQSTITFPTGH